MLILVRKGSHKFRLKEIKQNLFALQISNYGMNKTMTPI